MTLIRVPPPLEQDVDLSKTYDAVVVWRLRRAATDGFRYAINARVQLAIPKFSVPQAASGAPAA